MQLLVRLDRWLFDEYRTDAESLALYRILFAGYVLLVVLPTGLWSIPAAAYSPPVSLAALFTAPPPRWAMVGLNATAMVFGSSLLIGFFTAASSIGLCVSCVILDSFCFADGKIDPGFVVWIALILSGSGWGDAFSVDHHRRSRLPRRTTRECSGSLAVLAMVVGFALFTAGSAKIRGGWLRPSTSAMRFHVFQAALSGHGTRLAAAAWAYLPGWIWKLGDWCTVAWEMAFIATVRKKQWCRAAAALGAFFHLGVWLLFGVRESESDLAYGAFVGWSLLWPAATREVRALSSRLGRAPRYAACAIPFLFSACALSVVPRTVTATMSVLVSKAVLVFGALFAALYLSHRVRMLARVHGFRSLPIGRSPSDG